MYVVTLTYTAPLARIDELLGAHVAWLEQNYDTGVLLASGRRVPRTGGVLLVSGALPRPELDAVLATDPFAVAGVANYDVVEFVASKTAPGLTALTVERDNPA